MGERCPHSPARGTGWLVGWRLTFGGEELGWDGALATIVEDPAPTGLRRAVRRLREDERALDGWETPTRPIRKIQVRVHTLDGEQLAWVYVLDAYEGGLPSASYLGVIADAAEAAGAPDDYVADLRPALPVDSGADVFPHDPRPVTQTYSEPPPRPPRVFAERSGVEQHDVALVIGSGWLPAADAARGDPSPRSHHRPAGLRRTRGRRPRRARSAPSAPARTHLLVFLGRTHLYEGRGVARRRARRPDGGRCRLLGPSS